MESVHRRSRMKRTRTGKRVEIGPRDIEIFTLLSRYKYLRSTTIHAFVGGASEARFKDRLTRLFHEGFLDRPEPQWQFADCLHAPVVHEIGDGASEILRELGLDGSEPMTQLSRRAHRQFLHGLMICESLASIELGVRRSARLRLINWHEILSKAPEAIKKSEHPFQFPVTIACPVQREQGVVDTSVEPDAIFGLEYISTGPSSYRFFALEADRGTMPVWRSNLIQSSYLKKLLAYRELISRRLHNTRLGLPSLLVLTVTSNETRMELIKIELAKLTGASAPFLFTTFQTGERGDPQSQNLLSCPWLRVGHPPLRIDDPKS